MTHDEFLKLMDKEIDKAFNVKAHNKKMKEQGKEDSMLPEYNYKQRVREHYKEYIKTLEREILGREKKNIKGDD